MAKQLIHGLSALNYYGIIHRDIKHTNILCKFKDNKNITLKIIDFGLSKAMGYHDYADERYGSLSFKAPEIIKGQKYSFNIDIWALGVTLYYSIYIKYPFNGENKNELKKCIISFNPDTDLYIQKGDQNDYFNRILLQCFTKDPNCRPNASDLEKVE